MIFHTAILFLAKQNSPYPTREKTSKFKNFEVAFAIFSCGSERETRSEMEYNMIHPSYVELMKVVNSDVEEGQTPIVSSRYSIVMATAKRARQIVDGDDPLVRISDKKPLSIAVEELYENKLKIENPEDLDKDENKLEEVATSVEEQF